MDTNKPDMTTNETAAEAAEDAEALAPLSSPREALERYGAWFILVCLRYMRAHGNRLINDSGGYSPDSVSALELVHTVIGGASQAGQRWQDEKKIPPMDWSHSLAINVLEDLEKRTELTIEQLAQNNSNYSDILSILNFQAAFELNILELYFVLCVALVQYSDRYMRAWRYATGATSKMRINVDFLLNALEFLADSPEAIRGVLREDGTLRRYGLIKLIESDIWGADTPLAYASVVVPNRIVSYFLGEAADFVPEGCRMLTSGDDGESVSHNSACEEELAGSLNGSAARLAIIGYEGLGRTSSVLHVANKLGASVLALDLNPYCEHMAKLDAHAQRFNLAVIMREVRLLGAILVISCDGLSSETQAWLQANARLFRERFESESHLRICVTLQRQTRLTRSLFGNLHEIIYPVPVRESQPELWELALEPYLSPQRAQDAAQAMAKGYCLSYAEIRATVEQTLARRAMRSPDHSLTPEYLTETLNKSRGHKLEGLATLRSTMLFLDDIVLSPSIRKVLEDVLNFARYRDTVMQDWGFHKYNVSGAGLSVLFSGVPGTGKTLTSLVLAHELGRALYVIDLSQVVDKYIGETEKRLGLIFDEAERSQAMLLFDEADALFAKRTNVKSSNDRYANLEVNYLLQRLEAYSGVSILTTNFSGGLDEALARRIQFKIEFPMPDTSERVDLWRRLIPANAPLAKDINFRAIASHFEMSGGHIKNAVFRAAIQAAAQHKPIDHDMLWDAALLVYREMGHVVRDSDDY